MARTALYPITNCLKCPACKSKRTPGAGMAYDYFCPELPEEDSKIAGYVEWPSQFPKEVPAKCPHLAPESGDSK